MSTRPFVLALGCAALLALAGCSSTPAPRHAAASSTSSEATPATPATPAPAPTTSPSAKPASVAASPRTATVATCATRDLAVSLLPGDGEAGSAYYTIQLRNRSDHACRTRGYGGVSMVGGGNGTQVGAAADRDTSERPRRVSLVAGGRAVATLRVTQAQNYPAGRCRPVQVDGLRVYPPDQTRSAYVAQKLTGCRNAGVHLMTISAYRAGS